MNGPALKKMNSGVITVLLLLVLYGCKKSEPCNDAKNPQCPNYDSCLSKQRAYASFKVIQRASLSDWKPYFIDYNTDTIAGAVSFVADMDSADSYEWHIGTSATIYRTRQVNLNFGNIPTNTVINTTLIVRKRAVTACFPNDSGVAIVTRNIVYCDTLKQWVGKYEGYYTDTPSQRNTIYIGWTFLNPPFVLEVTPYIVGLRPYSDTMFNDNGLGGYSSRQYMLHSSCSGHHAGILGWVAIDSTLNNINILQTWSDASTQGKTVKKTFVGHRTN